MRLDELARQVDATVVGDGNIEITDVAPLEDARPGTVSFMANVKYLKQLETTRASAVIVAPTVESPNLPLLKVKDPYFAFTRATVLLRGHRKHPFTGIHPKAFVDPTATVGENTVVYPGAFIGPRTKVGRDCIIYPNVCIYDDCVIGDRVIIHANTTIGMDGYGFAFNNGQHHKIPQIGNVIIEDDVEIGSSCTIARASLSSTVIGAGTKIDSQVHIAHNCKTGKHCLIVAQAAFAGSTILGNYVTIAGQVGIAGHLTIGDKAVIAARSGIMNDVEPGATMMGAPAIPASLCRRVWISQAKLPDLIKQVRDLEQRVDELTDTGDTPIA